MLASVSRLLPSSLQTKIARRFHPALSSKFVESRLDYALKNWWDPESWMDRVGSLGEHAGRIAARHDSSILAYAHVATAVFSAASAGRRVLMQMQPHPASVKAALVSDRFLPEFQDRIRNETHWPNEVFERFSREPRLADLCVAASRYTRRTLIELTTTSCGASDLIVHEHNGFVILAANLDALTATLASASHHRERLREMRASARATAEEYPGSRFRRTLVQKLRPITADA